MPWTGDALVKFVGIGSPHGGLSGGRSCLSTKACIPLASHGGVIGWPSPASSSVIERWCSHVVSERASSRAFWHAFKVDFDVAGLNVDGRY